MRSKSRVEEERMRQKDRIVFTRHRKRMKCLAMEARESANHYDNFRVGGVVLARHPRTGRYKLFTCWNTKLLPGIDPNRTCAEDHGITQAAREGYTVIVGIVVVSPYKVDDLTGRDLLGTLPPCKYCRDNIFDRWMPKKMVSPDTIWLAVTVDEDGDQVEAETTIGTIMKKFPLERKLKCEAA